jgi:hypothetical protein
MKKSGVAGIVVMLAALALGGCAVAPPPGEVPPARVGADERELVVLVHGMGRSSLSMWRMERSLEDAGYEVLNWGYSSTCCTVDALGERLSAELERHPAGRSRRVHFVGHSLGTVIIRAALGGEDLDGRLGRLVLLAPPSRGARSADLAVPLLGWLMPPLRDLSTDSTSLARTLDWPGDTDVVVIAGRYDAKVSPAEARLDDAPLVILPATHTFLMMRSDAIRFTLDFLRDGEL